MCMPQFSNFKNNNNKKCVIMQVCLIWVTKFHASGDKLVVEEYLENNSSACISFHNEPASPVGLCLPAGK